MMQWTRRAALVCMLAIVSWIGTTPVDAQAQTSHTSDVAGTVTDASGKPVSDASVTLSDLGRRTRTGNDGHFTFTGVPAGQRTVVFEAPGYATVTRTVTLPVSGSVDVSLSASPFRVAPVSVTATRSPAIASNAPLSTSALDADQLRRLPTVSIAHALDRLAGVHTLATGQEMGKPVIRGLTGSRVLVMDNGHRMEDYSWSDEDGPSLDSRLAERVELVRGPASVLYGSDAIAGVVNAVPTPLPNAIGIAPFRHYGIEAYAASNNHEGGTVLRMDGANNGFGYRVTGIARTSEAIHTPDGELENTGYFALNGEAAAGIQKPWGNAELRVARYGGEFKLLEASGESPVKKADEAAGEEEGGPVRKLGDNRVQFDLNRLIGSTRLETKAQWQMHELAEVEEEGGAEPAGGPEKEGLELVLNTLSLDMLLHHSLSANTTGIFGITGTHQANDTKGLIPFIPDATRNSIAGFALEQWTAGRITLLGSVRGDLSKIHNDANATIGVSDGDRNFSALTFDAGAVARLTDVLALTGNIGRAFRAPNFFELFANGPQLGEARYVIGSTSMKNEHSTNLDAGLRLTTARVHGEVAAFTNRIDNYIFLTPTQQQIDSLRLFRYQQANARLTGGEATLELEATDALTLRGRADYVRGTNTDSDDPLPLIPPRTLEGGAELHGAFAGMERAYVEADVEHHDAPNRPNTEDIVTNAYTLLTVGAGFDHRVGAHKLRVDLRVHNATNASYRDFLYRYKEFALNPGRDIMLRASLDF